MKRLSTTLSSSIGAQHTSHKKHIWVQSLLLQHMVPITRTPWKAINQVTLTSWKPSPAAGFSLVRFKHLMNGSRVLKIMGSRFGL